MRRRRSLAAVIVAVLAVILAAGCGDDDDGGDQGSGESSPEARTTSGGELIGPADEGIEGVEAFEVASNAHTTEDLVYDHRPPVGGEHNPTPATCGFYESDPPPDQYLVHSIEHGSIWIAYGPDLPDADLQVLRDLAGQLAKVVVTPYEGLDSPIVVTAWARQLALDSADDPRLAAFTDEYRSSGQSPEPNAHCEGVGEPAVPAGTG